ncbi:MULTISPECIES: DNA/RNA non-specific endonuclease [Pontibacter]|uniref:DNA/RNA non-specific endonuclease n=1 Tax=Pontibacter TaxID=323449 RepID=UPI002026FCC7|nr:MULTISPECIES: DNA/RNA non-specific endonuclease [Pontibacter]
MSKWIFILTAFFTFTACERDQEIAPQIEVSPNAVTASTFYDEGFEGVYKSSYTTAPVAFANGTWNFADALTGNTTSDRKTGSQSARVRNSGKLTMSFDLPDGARSFKMSYAKYGTDANTTLQVYYSTNSGSTWTSAGTAVTVSKTSLQSTTYTLNVTGPVRFEIRKTDGTTNRVNVDDVQVESNPVVATPDVVEDYETGSKGSYAAGSVTLPTGNWYLNEALIGTLTGDAKAGTKSVRIRDLGSLEMQFDVQGAQSVSIAHAVYGTDAASTWQLQASTNGGTSWAAVGNTITTSSATLQTATFAVNYTSAVRFRVVKLSGSGLRINIDNFTISGSAATGGEPTDPTDPGTGGGGSTDTTTYNSVHLTLGNPSGAKTDVTFINNYLLQKSQFVMSYSRDKGTANWVSWHLDESWLGSTPRQDDFRADNTLPAGWYQVGSTDYTGSGFDRGHMSPSADRTATVADNSATFLMTNMIPQAPKNNQGAWATLEGYCRSMLTGGYEIYIISGGYGIGGTGSAGYKETLAGGKITVPNRTWKVIVIIPDGTNDAARVTTATRVIAVDMPNDQAIGTDWRAYRTTVDAIEAKTGYDFLSLVSDNVENTIEATVDAL